MHNIRMTGMVIYGNRCQAEELSNFLVKFSTGISLVRSLLCNVNFGICKKNALWVEVIYVVKVKCTPCTGTETLYRPYSPQGGGVEVQPYPFMTTALEGGEGSALRPGRYLPPGKTRYPLYRRLGGPQGRSGQVWKISPPPGFDPRTVQPVASRYTDDATRPTHICSIEQI